MGRPALLDSIVVLEETRDELGHGSAQRLSGVEAHAALLRNAFGELGLSPLWRQLFRDTARIAEGSSVRFVRLATLALVAGAPAIAGAWIGGFVTNDVVGVVFFALAVGAALQVVVEVGRYVARRAPGGLRSGYVVGGFLAGIAVMYGTSLIAG